MFVTYFMNPPAENYSDLLRNDKGFFVEYRKRMIEKGIFMLPVNLKRNHVSSAHTVEDVRETLEKAREALAETIADRGPSSHLDRESGITCAGFSLWPAGRQNPSLVGRSRAQ